MAKLRLLTIVAVMVALLMTVLPATALAAPGGEKGAPNMGLGIAVTNVIVHAAEKGANVTWGTHNAVGRIMLNNPAVDLCAQPFSLCD